MFQNIPEPCSLIGYCVFLFPLAHSYRLKALMVPAYPRTAHAGDSLTSFDVTFGYVRHSAIDL